MDTAGREIKRERERASLWLSNDFFFRKKNSNRKDIAGVFIPSEVVENSRNADHGGGPISN